MIPLDEGVMIYSIHRNVLVFTTGKEGTLDVNDKQDNVDSLYKITEVNFIEIRYISEIQRTL